MLHADLEQAIRRRFDAAPFSQWLGLQLVGISEGHSEIALDLQPHHLNPAGIAHGGVVASLLDVAIGLALRTRLTMEDSHLTAQLNVNYLRAAVPGRLVARGRALRSGRRVTFGEADLLDGEERLLARAGATMLVVPRMPAER